MVFVENQKSHFVTTTVLALLEIFHCSVLLDIKPRLFSTHAQFWGRLANHFIFVQMWVYYSCKDMLHLFIDYYLYYYDSRTSVALTPLES